MRNFGKNIHFFLIKLLTKNAECVIIIIEKEKEILIMIVQEWIIAHGFPMKILDNGNIILWLTAIQCGEYNVENDAIEWHNKDYFYKVS